MHEEVNGLRVLGSPIGSLSFQRQFITDYLSQANQDAIKFKSFSHIYFVISNHCADRTKLAEILHDVVNKRVVIINH